ncbi:MAG: GNAT family N-acetyltransferase [Desulfobacterales bacterium]|jgi:ribosomal protein S18 acetylase RimI-like enzyme
MVEFHMRHLEPADYPYIISVIDDWWGGRRMADMLPKLFFVHFRQTSFVAEQGENILGFIVGFVSQTFSSEAYIHFAGVHPDFRKKGLGCALYERFFDSTKKLGCNVVRCVTSSVNKGSVSFHLRMGFSIEPGSKNIDNIPVVENYDGSGEDRVLFYRALDV